MIRMTKLFDREILKEDWGKLIVLSDEVRNRLRTDYSERYSTLRQFGTNSDVKIFRTSAKDMYNTFFGNEEILAIVIRYGQEDLIYIENEVNSYRTEYEPKKIGFFDDIEDSLAWSERCDLPNKIKSESGFVKLCNNLINHLLKLSEQERFSNIFPNNKKQIIEKINFQVIYEDKIKKENRKKRNDSKNFDKRVVVNNVDTLSNSFMGKEFFKQRLEQYIISKLPRYTDINQIPKDMKLLKDGTRFKLNGTLYEYRGEEYGIGNPKPSEVIMNNEPFKLVFGKDYWNDRTDNPAYIVFYIQLVDGKWEVVDIQGQNRN